MKKVLTSLLVAILICATVFSLSSCKDDKLNFGKEYAPQSAMVDVLMALNAKSIDVGVMDSIMASYYMSQDSTYASNLMIVSDLVLAEEQYGIAARKGSGLAKKINEQLIALTESGKVAEIAAEFGLTSDLATIDTSATIAPLTAEEQVDWDAIVANGKLIIAYTDFQPIAFTKDGTLTGFDIELARAVCAELNLEPVFQVIEWSQKEALLSAKTVDCLWNALTITPERQANMEITMPYMNNKQVAVIRKADKDIYTNKETMANAIIGAEGGSAGEDCIVASDD